MPLAAISFVHFNAWRLVQPSVFHVGVNHTHPPVPSVSSATLEQELGFEKHELAYSQGMVQSVFFSAFFVVLRICFHITPVLIRDVGLMCLVWPCAQLSGPVDDRGEVLDSLSLQ